MQLHARAGTKTPAPVVTPSGVDETTCICYLRGDMNRRRTALPLILFLGCVALLAAFASCRQEESESRVIRIGHFPNITHVQALVARNMARHGHGWFEERMPGYRFEWYTFNAGPSAMEAVFGRTIDAAYVGPSPAINAYAVSRGKEIRILAGAVNGGAALLVHDKSPLAEGKDFLGKIIATPQLGNTQDVSARAWLSRQGLVVTPEGGGDCRIMPTPNAMQLPLFQQGEIDAVWTVEPWVSRLEQKAAARPLLEDEKVVTTILVGRAGWLEKNPEAAKNLARSHRELTQWIAEHPQEAQRMVTEELTLLTRSPMEPELVASAWKRLRLTNDIDLANMGQFVIDAQNAGFLGRVPPIEGMVSAPLPQAEGPVCGGPPATAAPVSRPAPASAPTATL